MVENPPGLKLKLPLEKIAAFCRRWAISKLEIFGSVLREDFRPGSDVDFLATFAADAHWSLLDRARMKHELEDMLHREVDLLNRRALEKRTARERAAAILAEARTLYAES